MEIKVLEINKNNRDEILIAFSSPYGNAYGFWMEQNAEINESYYVEFGIPQALVWGKDIKEAECDECKIWSKNDVIYVCAMFHSLKDNCLTIRLGESLILVETQGNAIYNRKFLTICFRGMNIHPYMI